VYLERVLVSLSHGVFFVMPALVAPSKQGVDGRDKPDKPGHDEWERWSNMAGIRL
jgi:hypothetical protein